MIRSGLCQRARALRDSAGILLIALLATIPCSAQSDTTTRIPRRLCWRGKPLPECTSFWITEFGIDASRWSTRSIVAENYGGGDVYRYIDRDFDSRLVWTLGPMFNTGPRAALGGTVSISPLGQRYRGALEVRRRWWSDDLMAFDVSAGALRMGVHSGTGPPYRYEYGLTAGALIVGADLVEVNGRVDVLVSGRKPRAGASLGLGGGSYVAVVGSIALGLLVLAIISAGPID